MNINDEIIKKINTIDNNSQLLDVVFDYCQDEESKRELCDYIEKYKTNKDDVLTAMVAIGVKHGFVEDLDEED